MAIRYRKVRVVNPTFNPAASRSRMVSPFRESQLKAAHKMMAREFRPGPPTVLSIMDLAEEYGIEVTEPDRFRDAVEEDLRRLGLPYQGDGQDRRMRNLARRMANGECR